MFLRNSKRPDYKLTQPVHLLLPHCWNCKGNQCAGQEQTVPILSDRHTLTLACVVNHLSWPALVRDPDCRDRIDPSGRCAPAEPSFAKVGFSRKTPKLKVKFAWFTHPNVSSLWCHVSLLACLGQGIACVAQSGLELTVSWTLWFSCLGFLIAGITSVLHIPSERRG